MTEFPPVEIWAEEEVPQISVTSDLSDEGKRADAFLAERTELTRTAAARLCESGQVLLSGKPVTKNYRLRAGDTLSFEVPEPELSEILPQPIPLDILYEDNDILVVNKPEGMVVHPAPGNPDGTLVNALMYHCRDSLSGVGGVIRPGIVHRIDKDTGGLLVVAKNDAAHLALAADIREHKVRRMYQAIALGNFREDAGTVDAPIGRHPTDRKRMAVIRDEKRRSREAVTHWRVAERFGSATHILCELETGRTHQIRVHMASIGHPLLGDPLYGGDHNGIAGRYRELICGQCLFASRLELTHPRTGELMRFEAPLPENFERLLQRMRKDSDRC